MAASLFLLLSCLQEAEALRKAAASDDDDDEGGK